MNNNIETLMLIIRTVLKQELDGFPMSCCYESSLIAEKVFKKLGYNISTFEGTLCGAEHYWNEIDGQIIDFTSDQFEEPWGIIKDKKNYKNAEKYSIKEQLEIFEEENDEELYEELYETNIFLDSLSRKCIRKINMYKCA